MTRAFLNRLDARDREWLSRLALGDESARAARRFWKAVTVAGGATFTIAVCVAGLGVGDETIRTAAQVSLTTLVVSHVAVQLVKRTVGRPRPSYATSLTAVVAEPDRFSFPSGHAAAAMSVAFGFAHQEPTMAPLLFAGAVVVGFSRVALAVHYPGDVLAGQALALLSGLFIVAQ